MTKSIESLPDRPLTPIEADALVEQGSFAPLTIKTELRESVEFGEEGIDLSDIEENSAALVYTLLYATDEKGVAIGYSEQHDEWLKIEEMQAEEYDHDEIETKVDEWVREHTNETNHAFLETNPKE